MTEEVNILPMYKIGIGELAHGIVMKCSKYCIEKKNDKCERFYKDIFNKGEGLYICPYGFNAYVLNSLNNRAIFTGFRVINEYDRRKADAKIDRNDINFVIGIDEMNKYIDVYKKNHLLQYDFNYLDSFINNTIHDIRKFNAHIKNKSNLIINKNQNSKKRDDKIIEKHAMNIWTMSTYISTRLDSYNVIYNPNTLKVGEMTNFNFFKSFDKMRKCLKEDSEKNGISINLSCATMCSSIQAYDIIELIPFVLLDNGIKYTLNGEAIDIIIEEISSCLKIKVVSIGPTLKPGEERRIFQRGYRGENAQSTHTEGSGIGLYVVKQICQDHDININVESSQDIYKTVNNIEYSKFVVQLTIQKNSETDNLYSDNKKIVS